MVADFLEQGAGKAETHGSLQRCGSLR
jgi:hypothetical protein